MINKFKLAEVIMRQYIPPESIVGLRLDGKAFHTFTKQFERPYDYDFMEAMDITALEAARTTQQSMFAYTQSDEITVFFSDTSSNNPNTKLPFDGRIDKILSTSASQATGSFLRALPDVIGVPVFDARLFVLDSIDEVQEYMDWRRLDARKNSISMAASALYSHKELMGKSISDRREMLKGTEFETLPEGFFEGRLVVRDRENRGWKIITATREETQNEVDHYRS